MYSPIRDRFEIANNADVLNRLSKQGYNLVPEPLQPIVLDHIKTGGTPKTMTDSQFKKWRKKKRAERKNKKKNMKGRR